MIYPRERSDVRIRSNPVTHVASVSEAPTMYVLVGPLLSGKTTYAEDRVLLGMSNAQEVLSMSDLDETGGALDVFLRVMKARSSNKRSLIADATNLAPASRRALVKMAKSAGLRPVAVVFDVPLDVLLDRATQLDADLGEVAESYYEYQEQRPLIDREFDFVIGGA